jgi:4-coumarate--CoA ligase
MALVPAIAIQMAKQPVEKKYDLRSLRMMTVGAAPIGKEIMEKLAAKLKCRILQGYGMTESSLRSHSNLGTRSRIGSIGVTMPFCQTKVMDPETGRSLGPNQNGEICVRGPIVMKGYFGDEKSTSSTIDADGWLHTGDIGHYDDDGFFYITDRMKELIKYKGLQVGGPLATFVGLETRRSAVCTPAPPCEGQRTGIPHANSVSI